VVDWEEIPVFVGELPVLVVPELAELAELCGDELHSC